MHKYSQDFYGQPLRLLVLGFIRCRSTNIEMCHINQSNPPTNQSTTRPLDVMAPCMCAWHACSVLVPLPASPCLPSLTPCRLLPVDAPPCVAMCTLVDPLPLAPC